MQPVELYKKLPKKNCGECKQRLCMPFALSVVKGEANLSECPYLTEEERGAMTAEITRTDWREELILRLREEVKGIRFSDIADGIGSGMDNGRLVLKCMGREFGISPDGDVTTHGHITPWIKILLLHYIRTAGKGEISGKWTSFSEFKGGMLKVIAFVRECEDPLGRLFDRDFDKVAGALERMGAEKRKDFPTQNAWKISLLPKIPAAILYWPAEEDFPSKAKVIFDQTAERFLDVESLVFLVEGLVKNIEMQLKPRGV
jgi:Domain of unknown function (DUF3786)/Putative Fe-S cluster